MTTHTQVQTCEEFVSKDGSLIRELMHPQRHASRQQSLAQAVVPPGTCTQAHYHKQTEELYHILEGQGWMQLNEDWFAVKPGDTVCIAANTTHSIKNTGDGNLVFLCCCAPAYSHEDTVLV